MILRKRDRIEMVLWAILAIWSVIGVVWAENGLDNAVGSLGKLHHVQTQR